MGGGGLEEAKRIVLEKYPEQVNVEGMNQKEFIIQCLRKINNAKSGTENASSSGVPQLKSYYEKSLVNWCEILQNFEIYDIAKSIFEVMGDQGLIIALKYYIDNYTDHPAKFLRKNWIIQGSAVQAAQHWFDFMQRIEKNDKYILDKLKSKWPEKKDRSNGNILSQLFEVYKENQSDQTRKGRIIEYIKQFSLFVTLKEAIYAIAGVGIDHLGRPIEALEPEPRPEMQEPEPEPEP